MLLGAYHHVAEIFFVYDEHAIFHGRLDVVALETADPGLRFGTEVAADSHPVLLLRRRT